MSIEAFQWVMKVKGVTLAERALLCVLANFHNGKTGKCFPSQAAIAEAADCTPRNARKHLDALEAKGFFTRTVTSFGKGLTTFYELNLNVTHADVHAPPTKTPQPNIPTGGNWPNAPRRGNWSGGPSGRIASDQMPLRGAFAIEEPEEEPESPSQTSNEVFEGRTPDLFEASPSSPPASPRREEPTPATKREMLADIVFKIGKPLLARDGLSSKEAGAFLGKLIKTANLEIVAKVVSQAAQSPPVDARQWLTAATNAEARKANIPRTIRKSGPIDWPRTLATWFDTGAWPRSAGPDPTDRACKAPTRELETVLAMFEPGHPTARSIRIVLDARKRQLATEGAHHV